MCFQSAHLHSLIHSIFGEQSVNEQAPESLVLSAYTISMDLQYNTIQLFYCFISFHMRHSQNTFVNMFNINTKNDISFREKYLNKENIYSPMRIRLYMLNEEINE